MQHQDSYLQHCKCFLSCILHANWPSCCSAFRAAIGDRVGLSFAPRLCIQYKTIKSSKQEWIRFCYERVSRYMPVMERRICHPRVKRYDLTRAYFPFQKQPIPRVCVCDNRRANTQGKPYTLNKCILYFGMQQRHPLWRNSLTANRSCTRGQDLL
jgi:hypothetical protein